MHAVVNASTTYDDIDFSSKGLSRSFRGRCPWTPAKVLNLNPDPKLRETKDKVSLKK